MSSGDVEMEGVEEFRSRARAWIRANLRELDAPLTVGLRSDLTDEEELAGITRNRELQRMFFDAGLAGICFPREYGGQGLTPAHQQALNEELIPYEYPVRLQIPTISPCASVILEFGTEEQKLRHLPAILKGQEIWIQFLSEPSGGSDVAGAQTSAVRDGDEWILNGSKVWSTGAWWSDWALCLARTNWDAPKHRGLTVFMLPIHQAGIEVRRIEMINGSREFCEEFLTDVRVPDSERIGEVDDGWTVGSSWMMHERMAYNSPLVTSPPGSSQARPVSALIASARLGGQVDDPRTLDLIGEDRVLGVVGEHLNHRLGRGMATGAMHPQSSAIGRLFWGLFSSRAATISFELAGAAGGVWGADGEWDEHRGDAPGIRFLTRQTSCIGGGTTEIARNVIAERVLGMPREPTPDRGDTPFRDVPRGARG